MSFDEVVVLNVGGTRFETIRGTLTSHPHSMLVKLFHPYSPNQMESAQDGSYFLDRDPETFGQILTFLRYGYIANSSKVDLDKLLIEANYFQLTSLEAKIQEIKSKNLPTVPRDLIKFNVDGTNVMHVTKEKFGDVPFHEILRAAGGVMDNEGAIVVLPDNSDTRPDIDEYQAQSQFYFMQAVNVIEDNGRAKATGPFKKFARRIKALKEEYDDSD
eukprot:TRINITY_DN18417_c0_g1_i1.p1 TRINITY_DN18417_c0_g1~~TRINITY_DN18417_c0_g1_i1.p1  ORF type:complete len:216 (-),score=52.80 TRINITY_DN18417_c0_g1_i1:109-756(-)